MKTAPVIVVNLIHIEGPLKGEEQKFFGQDEISIGRLPICHVKFPPDLTCVSREHARIAREGNRFKLIDKSRNSTFINGQEIMETVIGGEKIKVGYLKNGDILTFAQDGPKIAFLTEMTDQADIPQPKPPKKTEVSAPPIKQESYTPPENIQTSEPHTPENVQTPEPYIPPGNIQTSAENIQSQPEPVQVNTEEIPVNIHIKTVDVPFVMVVGANLHQYKRLPITLGTNPGCDLFMSHSAILDHHAQIFFHEDQYWIKDLTGQNQISVNEKPIKIHAPLTPDSRLSLSPKGPKFEIMPGGRLREIDEPVPEPSALGNEEPNQEAYDIATDAESEKKEGVGKKLFGFLKK